jgi:hypothetical protein
VKPFLQQSSGQILAQIGKDELDIFVFFPQLFQSFNHHFALVLFLVMAVVHHEKDVDGQIWIVKGQRLDGAGLADVQTAAAGRLMKKAFGPSLLSSCKV